MKQSYVEQIQDLPGESLAASVIKPELNCNQGNAISRLCLNPVCKVALICNQKNCNSCGDQIHPDCSDVGLDKLTNLINYPLHAFKRFLEGVEHIQNEHIQLLQYNRQEMLAKKPRSINKIMSMKAVDQIYSKKNSQTVSGEEAKQLFSWLKQQKQRSQNLSNQLIQTYSESVRLLSNRLIELRQIVCEGYINDGNVDEFLRLWRNKQHSLQTQTLKETLCIEEKVIFLLKGQSAGLGMSELTKLIQKYDISEPKFLLCSGEHQISRLCINPNCGKPSLMCNEMGCSSCGKDNHLQCSHRRLDGITSMLRKKAKARKDFVLTISQIQNNFISELQMNKKVLTQKYIIGNIKEHVAKIIQEIYKNNNNVALTGQQAKQIFEELQNSETVIDFDADSLIKMYRKQIEYMEQRLSVLKDIITSSQNLQPISQQVRQEGGPKKVRIKKYGYTKTQIDDQTMLSQFSEEQKVFICQALNHPAKIKLIFKASSHGFRSSKFHQICDNIKDTFVIARTQFGKTIAGYSHYKWNHTAGYVQDEGKKTFLMQVDLRQKMIPINSSCLIYCNAAYGPTFGGGSDFYISDICQSTSSSYAVFPHTYNVEVGQKYVSGQEALKRFSGASKDKYFKVQEYQVYEVIWNK